MKLLAFYGAVALFFSTSSMLAQGDSVSDKQQKMNPKESILENTTASGNHNMLVSAVKMADLESILDSEGPFTVFAPSDKAFGKLSKEDVTTLLNPKNKKNLHSLVTYHIVAGNLTASKMLQAMCRGNGKASFTTVQGDKIVAKMNGLDIVLEDKFGNKATIVTADANQSNGIIHVVDSVILPKEI